MCTLRMTSGATGAVQLWATLAVEPGDRITVSVRLVQPLADVVCIAVLLWAGR